MNEVITASDASLTLRSGAYQPSLIPLNLLLLFALLSLSLAQFLNPFSCWLKDRRWDSKKMLGSGGMPSSHSATVTALAASIGLQEGVEGSAFSIAAVLACVLLNQIVCKLPPEHPVSNIKALRDSLGHTPVQVIASVLEIDLYMGLEMDSCQANHSLNEKSKAGFGRRHEDILY